MKNVIVLMNVYTPYAEGESKGILNSQIVKPVDKWNCPGCNTLIVNESKCRCCGYIKR